MGDVFCRKCGEPWDSYGITHSRGDGDMTQVEAVRFLKAEGCPSCHWGKHCTQCSGTGKLKDERSKCACLGGCTLIIRKLSDQDQPWQYGYNPDIHIFPGEPKIIFQYPDGECKEGRYHEALALCPYCADAAPDCPTCHGTGELQLIQGDEYAAALWSLVEESDEDVIPYLIL
jgi:hypothetical protein